MHVQIARVLYYFEVHLLYATMVGLAAWALTSIRLGSATTKYWIWVATALNFIAPLGAILDKLGMKYLSWATPLSVMGELGFRIAQNVPVATMIGTVWLLGASLMSARLWLRLRAEGSGVRADRTPGFLVHGMPVRFQASGRGPAVDGVLRPQISLPTGIERVLSERELNAVILHELTHARRRDNLIRLVYELVLSVLWFHPLVWVAGSQLSLYRELSCDESVIRRAQGRELVSALAKLAAPREPLLLQATASSFMSHRLARLAARPQRLSRVGSALLIAAFGAALSGGVLGTVAHTACCFLARN
jgi:beta-lactamase regulating signal transducer with metallopeptidase domain